jgi:hypothetical protein
MISTRIETTAFRLAAQCLNELLPFIIQLAFYFYSTEINQAAFNVVYAVEESQIRHALFV